MGFYSYIFTKEVLHSYLNFAKHFKKSGLYLDSEKRNRFDQNQLFLQGLKGHS